MDDFPAVVNRYLAAFGVSVSDETREAITEEAALIDEAPYDAVKAVLEQRNIPTKPLADTIFED